MRSFVVALRASIVLMLICGLIYPLVTTGIAQVIFPKQAEGSLITTSNDKVIGSELIAQEFKAPGVFHPRASAAKYDPTASAATNAAVASPDYVKGVADQVKAIKQEDPSLTDIPADMVTTSGSGFDPDISPENAKAQVPRIAKVIGLSEAVLNQLVDQYTTGRQLGIFGDPYVNVLDINQALLQLGK